MTKVILRLNRHTYDKEYYWKVYFYWTQEAIFLLSPDIYYIYIRTYSFAYPLRMFNIIASVNSPALFEFQILSRRTHRN